VEGYSTLLVPVVRSTEYVIADMCARRRGIRLVCNKALCEKARLDSR
jgi:hypothetical protein